MSSIKNKRNMAEFIETIEGNRRALACAIMLVVLWAIAGTIEAWEVLS